MKTIKNTTTICVKVTDNELINGKWFSLQLLSKKVAEIEKEQNVGYKSYRCKMYNSIACNKYNVEVISGIKCIDTENPMKATASLEVTFKRG